MNAPKDSPTAASLEEQLELWERNEVATFLKKQKERQDQFYTLGGIPVKRVYTPLDASAPSTTNTRFSMTFACGARARSMGNSSWWVVQRRLASNPARAASSVPEQIVTRRCGVFE